MSCDTLLINVEYSRVVVAALRRNRLCEILVEKKDGDEKRILGNVYCGRVQNVVRGINAAFVDIGLERTALLPRQEKPFQDSSQLDSGETREIRARDFLIVQVEKEPVDDKGARLTTQISLPGRYVVLGHEKTIGVSKKIKAQAERKKLLALAQESCPPQRGLVVRTAAQYASDAEILRDIELLNAQMQRIESDFGGAKSVRLLHRADDLLFRVARDIVNDDVVQIVVDAPHEYSMLRELLAAWSPHLVERVELYEKARWILEDFRVAKDFQTALQRNVALPNGGNLIIDEVEALTAIDVNTAQFVGKKKLSETVLQTNLEAAKEIARQLRLRNIGGIVVIDFIDMKQETDRAQVLSVMNEALKQDRAKTRLVHFSSLGLLQMTRERRGHSLMQFLKAKCPCCSGEGVLATPDLGATEAYHLLGSALARRGDAAIFCVWLHVSLAEIFLGRNCDAIRHWQARWKKEVRVAIFNSAQGITAPRVEILAPDSESLFSPIGTRFYLKIHELCLLNEDYFAIHNHSLVKLYDVPQVAPETTLWIEITAHKTWFCEGKIVASGEPKTHNAL